MTKNKKRKKVFYAYILVLSVFILIGVAFYSSYLVATPQQVAGVSTQTTGVPTPTCKNGFRDSFTNLLDTEKWTIVKNANNSVNDLVVNTNGLLTEKMLLQSLTWRSRPVMTKYSYSGNFISEVDVLPLAFSATGSVSNSFIGQVAMRDATMVDKISNGIVFLRTKEGLLRSYQVVNYTTVQSSIKDNITISPRIALRLRIERSGNKAILSYKRLDINGSGFIPFKEYLNVPTTPVAIRLTATGSGYGTGIARFDNFALYCPTTN